MLAIKSLTPQKLIDFVLKLVFAAFLVWNCIKILDFPDIYKYNADCMPYYIAAQMIVDGKITSLYEIPQQYAYTDKIVSVSRLDWFLPFVNTPVSALIYIPFTYFPYLVSYKLYVILCTILLGVLVYYFAFINKIDVKYTLLLSLVTPLVNTIYLGQIFIFVMWGVALSITLLRKNAFLAGFFSGLLALKPQYLLLSPYLLVLERDRLKYILGFVTFIIVFCLGNVAMYGMDFFADYMRFLLQEPNGLAMSKTNGFNIFTIFLPLVSMLGTKTASISIWGLFLLLLGVSLFLVAATKTQHTLNRGISASILFVLILNVHSLLPDFSLWVFPILLLAKEFFSYFSSLTTWRKISISLMLLFIYIVYCFALHSLWYSSVSLFTLLFALYLIKDSTKVKEL